MPLLNLSDVTICAADSANLGLTVKALNLSVEQCRFADAILFSHLEVAGTFRNVKIAKIDSSADYQTFRVHHLPKLTDSPFVLSVEWDGFIIDPLAWKPVFFDYDYIGAKWPHFSDSMTVGNSGFCLQSRKLLDALSDPRCLSAKAENVDTLICRTLRPMLEHEYGIRFAPEAVADLFAYENTVPVGPTFGFHGCGNMWRHVDDRDMIAFADLVNPYVYRTGQLVVLILNYWGQHKFLPLRAIYRKMRQHVTPEDILQLLMENSDDATAKQAFADCERLLA